MSRKAGEQYSPLSAGILGKVKAEHINPFIQAACSVLQQVANLKAEIGKLSVKQSPYPTYPVAVVVGVTGDIKGQVVYSMEQATAKRLASAMMMGMQVEDLNELAISAISEFGNMISGNAVAWFSNGYRLDITPPSIFIGDNMSISTNQIQSIEIPLHTGHGIISMTVALKEAA